MNWNMQQEMESEFNARFDYIEEAYGPTRDDCTLGALFDELENVKGTPDEARVIAEIEAIRNKHGW